MECVEHLRRDHALIARVLDGVDTVVHGIEAGSRFPRELVVAAIEFFGSFVGRYHDAKEEEGLFPLLARRGPHGPALATIQSQHDDCRARLGSLAATLRGGAYGGVATELRGYVAALRAHVSAETDAVLTAAERVLTPADDAEARRAFDAIEARELAPGGREALVALADVLARAYDADASAGRAPYRHVAVREIMRRAVATIAPQLSLARAIELMNGRGVRELPVVERGRLVGILTTTDLVPHRGHEEWTAVRTAMTPDPITVGPDTPIRDAASLLLAHRFNALPVVDGGSVVGMVARSDLVRVVAGAG